MKKKQAKIMMTLQEAIEVRDRLQTSMKMSDGYRYYRTSYSAHELALAGATIRFCYLTGRTSITDLDLSDQYLKLKAKWYSNGKYDLDPMKNRLLSIEKILENEGVSIYFKEDDDALIDE